MIACGKSAQITILLRRWLDTSVELRKRNEQIKELQLDLRIANREIKNLKGVSEATDKIRGQAAEVEKVLQERTSEVESLNAKVAELEEELQSAKELAQQNELAAETEHAKLQERLRMLQDTTSTQSVSVRGIPHRSKSLTVVSSTFLDAIVLELDR